MTKITIFKKNGMIFEYQIKGHSGYAEQGSDIVCSAISVASQMALVGIKEVLKINVKEEIKDGYLHVEILEKLEQAQPILQAMQLTLEDISKNYARYIKMEVKEYVD